MRGKVLGVCGIIAAALVALAAILPGVVMADEYTATTMRLLRYEGSVEIQDASGAPRTAMENMRFDSGESMRTGAASSASIGLDSSKIVTMDENSRVEFVKDSKAIAMTLREGGLLLDVQEKLGDGESCEVKTATMAVGIRGTIVYLSAADGDDEKNVRRIRVSGDGGQDNGAAADSGTAVSAGGGTADSGSGSTSTLRVLEGTAAVTVFTKDGGQKELEVSAGQKVSVTDLSGDGRADEVSEVQDMDESDLNMFVTGILRGDQNLFKRVESASDLLDFLKQYSSKGDWEWKEKVTLVAQSASKFYDGTPLTRQGDILVYGLTFTAGSASKTYDGTELTIDSVTVEGLPEGFTYTAVITGSRTDAGTGSNTVSSYTILDAQGNDVTSQFTNVSVADGALEVEPLNVYVDPGIDEGYRFEYTGEPIYLEWFKVYYEGQEEDPVDGVIDYIEEDGIRTATTGEFELTGGGKVKLTFDGFTDAGEYTLTPAVSFEAGKEDNYKLNYLNNVVAVDPLKVYFNLYMNGATVFYDGDPIVVEWFNASYDEDNYFEGEISYETGVDDVRTGTVGVFELDGGGKVKLFFDGINAPGEYTLTPDDVTFESGNPDNYSLEYIDNELTVMKLG